MNLAHPCCWGLCRYWAVGQVVIPAPDDLGGRAIIWFCAAHERAWQVALGASALGPHIVWATFAFGRAPMVRSSVP